MPEPVLVFADHPLLETAPFFGPMLIVVAVIATMVVRDRLQRRRGR